MSDPNINAYAFARRDAAQARQAAVAGKVVRTSGMIQTSGAGEGLVDVNFANLYTEEPLVSFGGVLASNQAVTKGNFPTVSVVVAKWKMQTLGPGTYWVGATLALVTGGPSTQVMYVHWHVEGKALSSPSDVAQSNGTGNA